MKKNFFRALAALMVLAAMAGLMTACADNGDNPASPSGGDNQWGAKELTFKVGSAEFKMIELKGGEYALDMTDYQVETSVTVKGTLSPYYIGQTEVTNKLWAAVMGSKPAGQANDGDDYPVAMVNYYDIMAADGFMAKLNKALADQLPAGKMFRLPSDVQWQYALEAGKAASYDTNNLSKIAWIMDNAENTTHPVAQTLPNEIGLYDMLGNVWEWTRDNYLELDELPTDQGKDYSASNGTMQRVKRGCGYRSKSVATHRANDLMANSLPSIGFRLVLADAVEEETITIPPKADKVISISIAGTIVQYFNMVEVKGGDYSMTYERDGETKTFTGTLSDYYICDTEIENGVWYAVMGSKPEGQSKEANSYPVTMVSYYDIVKKGGFLDKLNEMAKDQHQLPAGKKLALPTEAQWHYAAMGGQKSKGYKYAGSNTLSDVAWYKDNSNGTSHPVGLKFPNELGIYDMTGNVWEWTRDRFAYFDEMTTDQGKDYAGAAEGPYRVARGGGYASGANAQPISYRDWTPMTTRAKYFGFRLVLVDEFEQEDIGDEPIMPEKTLRFSITSTYGNAGLVMVEVKGGNYSMNYVRPDETLEEATGTLSDYYIDQIEVTNDLWYIVMGSKPEGQPKSGGYYPVSMVTYEDITKEGGFLDKLNELAKDQLPSGKKFALPTEAEWHYAAMGGQKSKGYTYAGSNTIDDVAWYKDNSNETTHPVTSKLPNELGIYDMSGNVWEITNDKKDDANVYFAGGGWTSESQYCKVSITWADPIDKQFENGGFRLVLK